MESFEALSLEKDCWPHGVSSPYAPLAFHLDPSKSERSRAETFPNQVSAHNSAGPLSRLRLACPI